MDSVVWKDAGQIDRRAHRLRSGGHSDALVRLILSVPLPEGVRLAGSIAAYDPLIARMAATAPAVARVAATVAEASTSVHSVMGGRAHRLSFGFGGALTLRTVESSGLTRIAMLRSGAWHDVYHGEASHQAVACVDEDNVIAVREHPANGRELVHYARGEEKPVAQSRGILGTLPAATALGFVAGLALQPTALVAGPNLALSMIDMSPFGLAYAHRLAVSPSGDAVAFGGEAEIVITDARLENRVAQSVVPTPYGPVGALCFTSPSEVVAFGRGGGLSRWRISVGEALVLEAVGKSPLLKGVFSVPAWGVIGGHAGSEGHHRFFDPETLSPADPPGALAAFSPPSLHAVVTSPDGRFAATGGITRERSPALVIHDLHHSLARLLRPAASLDAADLAAISAAAGACTGEEREVLELLHTVALSSREAQHQ